MGEIYTRILASELNEVYLFHKQYTGELRSKYVWEWQYGSTNPFPSVLVGGRISNELVATQGMFTIYLKTQSGIELTGKNESLLIDELHRGSGLSKRLYKFAIEEYRKKKITCLWGFSRKAIVPLQRAGFKVYFEVIKRAVLSMDVSNTIHLVLNKKQPIYRKAIGIVTSVMATIFSKLLLKYATLRLKNVEGAAVNITDTLQNKNDLLALFENIREVYPQMIHINQDYEYYKWRILLSPLKIIKRFLYADGALVGYFYLTYHENYTEITDLTFIQDVYGRVLLGEITNIMKNERLKMFYYNFNSANDLNLYVNSFLKKFGFLNTKGPNHFVLLNFSHDEAESFFSIENWYINNLWNEGI